MNAPEINQVFEWLDRDGKVVGTERVLYILYDEKSWMVIRLPAEVQKHNGKRNPVEVQKHNGRGKHDFPFERTFKEYADAFARHGLRIAAEDPFEHAGSFILNALLPRGADGEDTAIRIGEKGIKHCERFQKNWLMIKGVVEDSRSLFSETRGKLVADAAKAAGRQKSEVYDYCIRYWQRGQVAANISPLWVAKNGKLGEVEVAGKKRGPRAKMQDGEMPSHTEVAVGPEERRKLLKGVKEFHLNRKFPLQAAYLYTIRKHWSEKVTLSDGIELERPLSKSKCPSFRQFLHVWLKFRHDNFAFVRRKLAGEREFTLTERPLLGSHTRKVNRPGQCFEIDAHIADCELAHSVTRRPIDRPTVYLVIDIFSHVIVGVAITLEPPSYIGAALALINAFTDKVDYCKQHGIAIDAADWPCQHLCKSLAADRGELLSKHANVLSAAFDINKEILPSYRPDMKPLVERFFKRLNEKRRHQLPGAVSGAKQRGKRNPKLDARLDIKQYSEIVILTILELNSEWMKHYPLEKAMIAEGVKPVLLELWRWGVQNRSGKLRQKPKEFVVSNLIPRATAEVTRSGIEFQGFEYSLPSNIDENWQLAASHADAKIEIAYDSRLVDAILLCDELGIAGK